MIQISKNETNSVYLTLKEKTTLSEPHYLFEFTSSIEGIKKYFIAEDVSTMRDRYNEFIITETANEDLLNGAVELSPSGYWTYNIYEQESAANLDPALAGVVVETGIVQVGGNVAGSYYQDENGYIIVR